MSNQFKVGDRLVRTAHTDLWARRCASLGTSTTDAVLVTAVYRTGFVSFSSKTAADSAAWDVNAFRVAIAGVDYAATPAQPEANTGHLPDGSSVQKHSAGPIYPCVIVLRDKRLKGLKLFDYGLISPRNQHPIWFSTLEAAHAVADIINKDIAP